NAISSWDELYGSSDFDISLKDKLAVAENTFTPERQGHVFNAFVREELSHKRADCSRDSASVGVIARNRAFHQR
ncbi:hypothetical protein THAOC_15748, partial [Thalassiosira oceanica]